MNLQELAELLRDYAHQAVPLALVHERLRPVLAADPLDVSASDASRWDAAPDEERLFWRLVYLVDSAGEDSDELRTMARLVVSALAHTGSPSATHELLPLLFDQHRLCTIIARHQAGIISRTGFLSVVAESGYAAHVKLWLEHASPEALERLAAQMLAGEYLAVLATLESRPD